MEKTNNPNRSRVLICVFGAVMFTILSILTNRLTSYSTRMSNILYRIDLAWVFWLMVLCAVACLVLPVIYLLQTLDERRRLPKSLAFFFGDRFRNWRESATTRLIRMLRGELGYLAAAGTAILILMAVFSNTYFVRDREMAINLNEFVAGFLHPARAVSSAPTAVQIELYTASSNTADYLRHCSRIVKDLENIGAKGVLVDLRGRANSRGTEEHKLIAELGESKIVVFGLDYFWDLSGTPYSRGIFTFRPFESYLSPRLNRIKPAADALEYPERPLDVSLELLRKLKDYPESMKPVQKSSVLVFGDYHIPVTTDGWMYSRPRNDFGYVTSGLTAEVGRNSDTLIYHFKTETYSSLSELREQLGGKVFFISWENERSWWSRLEDIYTKSANIVILDNILRDNIVRKVEISPLWLAILCLAVSIFLAHKFSPFVSVMMIFLFGGVVLVIDSLLYDRANLLIEITYPLLSILMAMVILPALSFVHSLRES